MRCQKVNLLILLRFSSFLCRCRKIFIHFAKKILNYPSGCGMIYINGEVSKGLPFDTPN